MYGRCDAYVLANQYILLQVDVGHHDILLKPVPHHWTITFLYAVYQVKHAEWVSLLKR